MAVRRFGVSRLASCRFVHRRRRRAHVCADHRGNSGSRCDSRSSLVVVTAGDMDGESQPERRVDANVHEAMRTMRDNFYDPNLHGVDWPAVTERYRPLVKRLTSKNELRDVLEQALGELSVLHVFVDRRRRSRLLKKIGMGQSSACLGAKFEQVPQGLRILKIYDTSEVLMAPNSPLSAMAVDLDPAISSLESTAFWSTLCPILSRNF